MLAPQNLLELGFLTRSGFVWSLVMGGFLSGPFVFLALEMRRLYERSVALRQLFDRQLQYEQLVHDAREEREQLKMRFAEVLQQNAALNQLPGILRRSKPAPETNLMTTSKESEATFPVLKISAFVDAYTAVLTGHRTNDVAQGDELYVLAVGISLIPEVNVPLVVPKVTLEATFAAGLYVLAKASYETRTVDNSLGAAIRAFQGGPTQQRVRPALTSAEHLFLGNPAKESLKLGAAQHSHQGEGPPKIHHASCSAVTGDARSGSSRTERPSRRQATLDLLGRTNCDGLVQNELARQFIWKCTGADRAPWFEQAPVGKCSYGSPNTSRSLLLGWVSADAMMARTLPDLSEDGVRSFP